MIEVKLGNRYAKSILELAKEKGELEAVHADFILIETVCNENEGFVSMLKSPLIKQDKKQRIIQAVFKDKLSTMTSHLVEIIIRKKRESYLFDIAESFLLLYDKEKNITRGSVKSVNPLTDSQKQKLEKLIEDQFQTNLILEEFTDESLIGGFVLKVGDKLFDASFSTQLRKLKQEFDNNPYIKV